MFQVMPNIRWSNDNGTEMQWRWINGEWHWKHVSDDGTVLAEGVGAP